MYMVAVLVSCSSAQLMKPLKVDRHQATPRVLPFLSARASVSIKRKGSRGWLRYVDGVEKNLSVYLPLHVGARAPYPEDSASPCSRNTMPYSYVAIHRMDTCEGGRRGFVCMFVFALFKTRDDSKGARALSQIQPAGILCKILMEAGWVGNKRERKGEEEEEEGQPSIGLVQEPLRALGFDGVAAAVAICAAAEGYEERQQ